ncbi:MAG: hypothetical protein ACOY15_13665 [Pseudomonadota bacterium]
MTTPLVVITRLVWVIHAMPPSVVITRLGRVIHATGEVPDGSGLPG